jgi:hypothetical protein
MLQWYCNTGEELDEQDLSNTTKYYRWVGEKRELVYDQSKDIWYQDSFSSKFSAPDVIKEKKVVFVKKIIFVFVCGVAAFLFFGIRKKFIGKSFLHKVSRKKHSNA